MRQLGRNHEAGSRRNAKPDAEGPHKKLQTRRRATVTLATCGWLASGTIEPSLASVDHCLENARRRAPRSGTCNDSLR